MRRITPATWMLSALLFIASCSTVKWMPTSCPRCQRTYFNTYTYIEGTNVIHQIRCLPCKWAWSVTNALPQ